MRQRAGQERQQEQRPGEQRVGGAGERAVAGDERALDDEIARRAQRRAGDEARPAAERQPARLAERDQADAGETDQCAAPAPGRKPLAQKDGGENGGQDRRDIDDERRRAGADRALALVEQAVVQRKCRSGRRSGSGTASPRSAAAAGGSPARRAPGRWRPRSAPPRVRAARGRACRRGSSGRPSPRRGR